MANTEDEADKGTLRQVLPLPPEGEEESLDPEFEAALTAALALDATERIEKLSELASALKKDLDSSR
ncbi:MAG: hypothetical protein SPI83_02895 [Rothia sp. (in: high G+C Gram-positive bacteria)]|nr:hypothetical protein [Rothia sp. (in: high G+C Gram-positive bacteria)]